MTNPQQMWCEHLEYRFSNVAGVHKWFFNPCKDKKYAQAIFGEWDVCPVRGCGARRPVQNDALEEIFKEYHLGRHYTIIPIDFFKLRRDLIAWRDKAVRQSKMPGVDVDRSDKILADHGVEQRASSPKEMYQHGYRVGRNDEKIVQERAPKASSASEAKAERKSLADMLCDFVASTSNDNFFFEREAEAVKDWIRQRMPGGPGQVLFIEVKADIGHEHVQGYQQAIKDMRKALGL